MEYSVGERANPQNREEKLFYPQPVWGRMISEANLTEEISYACSVNRSDVRAVLSCLMDILPRHLMEGETVRLEEFGIFRLGFDTKGEASEEAVSEKDILQAKVLYRPDVKIKVRLKSTVYRKSSSRAKDKKDSGESLEG